MSINGVNKNAEYYYGNIGVNKNTKFTYEKNVEDNTTTTYVDREGDGKTDSSIYDIYNEDGDYKYSFFDLNNDGEFDMANRYYYWEPGELQAIEVDEDGDFVFDSLDFIGNDGEITGSTRNYVIEE